MTPNLDAVIRHRQRFAQRPVVSLLCCVVSSSICCASCLPMVRPLLYSLHRRCSSVGVTSGCTALGPYERCASLVLSCGAEYLQKNKSKQSGSISSSEYVHIYYITLCILQLYIPCSFSLLLVCLCGFSLRGFFVFLCPGVIVRFHHFARFFPGDSGPQF